MAKLSAWCTNDAPVRNVTYCLPALISHGFDLVLGRLRPHPQHAVFGMEDHLPLDRHMVGDQRRDADAEIDAPTLGNVAREARGHREAAQGLEICDRCVRHGARPVQNPGWVTIRDMQHPVHEDAGRHDVLGAADRPVRRRAGFARW